jgi:Cu-processing system ATP-binding protein
MLLMLSIRELSKSFGKNQVLNSVTLELAKPGVYAILGPNGSGKTTLIKSILGMVIPSGGDVKLFGESVLGKWKYRDAVAYLPQIARFPENLKVSELFRMITDLRDGGVIDNELIELFGLTEFLDKRLGNLSGGTRQKVNLVLTFIKDCPFIVLDEPTAGLDPISIVRLKTLIKDETQKGKIILITTHVMSLVEDLADEIIYLLEGSIHFRGNIDVLLKTYERPTVEEAIASLLEKEGEKTSEAALTISL